ncbi:MAG: hypothetical protein AABZ63_04510 [Actinomycetota bacterium]
MVCIVVGEGSELAIGVGLSYYFSLAVVGVVGRCVPTRVGDTGYVWWDES